MPPEFPGRPERLGPRAASLPLPQRRVWTKGHLTHRGPSVKSPRTPSRSPSREWQGACRHPQRQHGTGQPSAQPASAPGRRGTDDGQRQRPRGRQEVDGPAQPGDRGPPTRLPICQRLPFPRHKGDPATPPPPPPSSTKTHRSLEGRGCSGHRQGTVWAKNSLCPPPAPVQPAQGVSLLAGSPGQPREQHLSPRPAPKASQPRDHRTRRKQAGPGLPAPDSPGHVGSPTPSPGGGRGGASPRPDQQPPNPWRLGATPAHQDVRAQACFWLLPGPPLPGTRP